MDERWPAFTFRLWRTKLPTSPSCAPRPPAACRPLLKAGPGLVLGLRSPVLENAQLRRDLLSLSFPRGLGSRLQPLEPGVRRVNPLLNYGCSFRAASAVELMLKIHRPPRGDTVVLAVSGRLDGEVIGELRGALEGEAGRILVIDLAEMRLIDRAGVRTLAECEAAGVSLEHCPKYARRSIDAETE